RDFPVGLRLVAVVVRPLPVGELPQSFALLALGSASTRWEHLVEQLQLDVRIFLQVQVPVWMRGRAAPRRNDHVAIAVLLVDQWLRARLAALPALRRQQQDLRASFPPVADLAAGLPVALHVLFAEQALRLTHLDPPSRSSLLVNLACVLTNRSAPPATVTPVLISPDVRMAVAWLESAFGFEERVRIGDAHRAQLRVGSDGALVVADVRSDQIAPS